ncbi:hypothetical protein R1flu_021246 [Riccia fluitans]|uniref:Uncharacterized protein n=1 Tax=Riccia fluitans TaxID=41844 RepID=A0ABD1ZP12_9MARC
MITSMSSYSIVANWAGCQSLDESRRWKRRLIILVFSLTSFLYDTYRSTINNNIRDSPEHERRFCVWREGRTDGRAVRKGRVKEARKS